VLPIAKCTGRYWLQELMRRQLAAWLSSAIYTELLIYSSEDDRSQLILVQPQVVATATSHRHRGVTRGARGHNFPGAEKSQQYHKYFLQYVCFRKASVSNMGAPNLLLVPGRHLTSLRPWQVTSSKVSPGQLVATGCKGSCAAWSGHHCTRSTTHLSSTMCGLIFHGLWRQ